MASQSQATELMWYKDLNDFFLNTENLPKFIPDSKMTLVEQLNAVFRFALYFTIVVSIIKQDIRVMLFVVFVGLLTFAVAYHEDKNNQVKESLMNNLNINYDRQKRVCSLPTKQNPFMNVLMSDYTEFPNKPPACNINNKRIKQAINMNATDRLYQDIDDVYDRNANNRQFFTNPVTSIPNSQDAFAHWLYNNGATCKERSVNCS